MKLRRNGDLLEPSTNISCTTSSSLASSAWLPANRVHGPNSDMSGAGLTKDIEVRHVDLLAADVDGYMRPSPTSCLCFPCSTFRDRVRRSEIDDN